MENLEAQTVGMDVSDHTQQRESVVGATTQVNGEMGNSTHHHAARKPLNRLSQRLHT